MTNNLEILKENRTSLLLAEAAAWLADGTKCSEEHLQAQSSDPPPKAQGLGIDKLTAKLNERLCITLDRTSISMRDLIREGRKGDVNETGVQWVVLALRRCHDAAHVEKEKPEKSGDGQLHSDTRPSNPFGYEGQPLRFLTAKLGSLPYSHIQNRAVFEPTVRAAFLGALGDTRRPVNEVTLWDWSSTVAALYKAAVAKMLLEGASTSPNPYALRWRLLSIRLDGAGFTERVARLPDLLARRKLLTDGLNRVRTLLEETFPLGTEIYRDENGSVFVVPDGERLLALKDGTESTLSQLILSEFSAGTINTKRTLRLGGEILPAVTIDPHSWAGSWPQWYPQPPPAITVPPVSNHVTKYPFSLPDPQEVAAWWTNSPPADVCPVCGLRPQGLSEKAARRKVCDVCEQRREDRAREWAENLDTTIWTDEVADQNGRLALIVGQFGVEEWLKPGGMVQTLFVEPPDASTGQPGIFKNPSFARLRRVWESTRQFWQEVQDGFTRTVGPCSPRLRLHSTFAAESGEKEEIVVSRAYELVLGNSRLSLVCVKKDEFLTAENLLRLAELLGAREEDRKDHSTAAAYIRGQLLQARSFAVEEPTGYGSPNKLLGSLRVASVDFEATSFIPAIPILAEPRTFMALVPADRALNVAQAVKEQYERQMGKVRNRLPLTLGLIMAGSRTPMAAILDAGRRMLKQPVHEEHWTLHADAQPCGCDCVVTFTNGITWRVPIRMGDGSTEDVWYPYFLVSGAPIDRRWMIQKPDGRWLVHVSKLKKGDTVFVLPSCFDFEWLDATTRRFEVSYTENGRRRGERSSRPYYLEALTEFEEIWRLLRDELATSQIQNINHLIETKRADWESGSAHQGFAAFVRDVLVNANWKHGVPTQLERLCAAALSGSLSDVIELYMKILKEKLERDVEEVSP